MNISSSTSGISLLASNLFNKLDTKQKGYLEQSDMQSALSSLSSSSSTASTDVSEAFTQLDADSDGKVTKAELSNGLQTLADALYSQLQQSRMHGPGDEMNGGPPPPPGDSKVDEGFTQEQLSTMAADGSTDSKRATLMGKLAANFDAADTDGNGKVTRKEAMAYEQATRTDATATSDTTSAARGTSDPLNLKVMVQIMQLLQAYGASSSNTESTSSNALSVSA